MNTKKITLSDGKEITVSLLPLRAYGDRLVALQGACKSLIAEFDGADTDAIIEKLPGLIQANMDEAGAIIELGTRGQISAGEALDKRGLADAVEVIVAIVEVNDFERIASSVKKAAAVFRKRKAPAATLPTK